MSCPQEDPCENTGTFLDNLDTQAQADLEQLWEESNYATNGIKNPEYQRLEQAAFLIPEGNGQYTVQRVKDELIGDEGQGHCHIATKYPENLPEGTIYVHSHPYSDGETQECYPGQTREYKGNPGIGDDNALKAMGVEGMIMDANKIIFHNENGITDEVNRCGY